MSLFQRIKTHQLRFAILGVIMSLVCLNGIHESAHAVPAKDTSTSGNWNTGGNWTPAGVPVAGDSVNVDLNMTVSSSASFGDNTGTEDSLIGNASSVELTINSSQQLTHVAGSTLVTNGSNVYISGPGTFRNEGTINLLNDRFLLYQNNVTMDNVGAFNFNQSAGYLEIRAGTNFNNLTGGTVTVDLPAATDFARMIGTNNFNISGGSKILFSQGILSYGFSNNGTMNDTAFNNAFDVASLNSTSSQVFLTGSYDAVNFTNATNLDNVRLGSSLDTSTAHTFTAAAGGTSINVTNSDGIHVANRSGGYTVFSGGSGSSITNEVGSKIIVDQGTNFFHIGDGTFINEGTMELARNRFLFWQNSPHFYNSGTMTFTGSGTGTIELNATNSEFRNLPGGQITINMNSLNDDVRITSPLGLDRGDFINQGAPITITTGTLSYEPGNATTINDAVLANLFDVSSLNANSQIFLGGQAENITLTAATDLSRIRLGAVHGTGTAPALQAAPGGTTLNFTAPGGIQLTGNSGYNVFHADTGNPFTNVAGSKIVAPNSSNFFFTGSGGFYNEGELEIRNSRVLLWQTGTPTLNNSGTMVFNTNGGRVELRNGFSFNNSGLLQISMPSSAHVAHVDDAASTTGTFTNTGTVEVLAGRWLVDPNILLPQLTSNSLTGGDWRVLSTGINSTLDLQASGTSAGSITTIGAGASLVMSSSGGGSAIFPQLGAISNLGGEFYVHEDHMQTVSNAMTVTGTLGGDGTFLTTGSISFTGGELDPSALSGGPGTLTIDGNLSLSDTTLLSFALSAPNVVGSGLNDLVEINGDLILDGVLDVTTLPGFGNGVYRLFNYTGTLTDNGVILSNPNYVLSLSTPGQVNLLLVPEPSTGLLLLTGILVFRRKRRNQVC